MSMGRGRAWDGRWGRRGRGVVRAGAGDFQEESTIISVFLTRSLLPGSTRLADKVKRCASMHFSPRRRAPCSCSDPSTVRRGQSKRKLTRRKILALHSSLRRCSQGSGKGWHHLILSCHPTFDAFCPTSLCMNTPIRIKTAYACRQDVGSVNIPDHVKEAMADL